MSRNMTSVLWSFPTKYVNKIIYTATQQFKIKTWPLQWGDVLILLGFLISILLWGGVWVHLLPYKEITVNQYKKCSKMISFYPMMKHCNSFPMIPMLWLTKSLDPGRFWKKRVFFCSVSYHRNLTLIFLFELLRRPQVGLCKQMVCWGLSPHF